MCGYNSSTFMSVESPEMACCMFNMSIADAEANEATADYRGLIGIYTSKITEDSPYASLCEGEGSYYLIEFNNDKKNDADFAIFDAAANKITYHKN